MRFLVRRLLLFVFALWVVSLVIFVAIRILPGDLATVMAGMNSSPEQISMLRTQLGLDRSLPEQYSSWLLNVVHGDFGSSMTTGTSVSQQIVLRSTVTLPLVGLGLCLAVVLGLMVGCVAVMASRFSVRSLCHVVGLIAGSVPVLWGGFLLILLCGRGSGLIGIFPTQGFPQSGWQIPSQALQSLILPVTTLGIVVGATISRYTRSALNEISQSGWIDMARSCGMTRNQALTRVGLRLALPQLVSVVGLTFAEMITGAMVVENLFALPGLGAGLISDIGNRDLIAVESELFMLTVVFLTIGFVVDLLHRMLDPRLKFSSQSGSDDS
jgi:peptide/nickel transport system permease protein